MVIIEEVEFNRLRYGEEIFLKVGLLLNRNCSVGPMCKRAQASWS